MYSITENSKDTLVLVFVLVVLFELVFIGNVISTNIVKLSQETTAISGSITLEGTSEVIHYDYFDEGRSENFYYLRANDGTRYKLNFPYGNEPNLISGKNIRVTGILTTVASGDTEINVENLEVLQDTIAGAEPNPNLGEQMVAVILVNFQDNPIEPSSIEYTYNITFDNTSEQIESLNDWIIENSYDKTWLAGNVFGWYTLPYNAGSLCELDALLDAVISAADQDIYFLDYNRLMIVFPGTNCLYNGVAYIGSRAILTADGESITSYLALNGMERINGGTGAHELGHNFGLNHANFLDCKNSVIGGDCTSFAYGDLFDLMGWTESRGHFNAYHKETVGWLDSSNILDTLEPGTYFIEPIETEGSGVTAMRISTPLGFSYYLEYRRPIGFDTINYDLYGTTTYNGVMIHINLFENGGDTQLLDTSLDTGADYVVVQPGKFFFDPYNGLIISTIEVTDENVQIMLSYPVCGNNIVELGEECDGNNLSQKTCQDLGYRNGFLSCSNECEFNFSQCQNQICAPSDDYLGENNCRAVIDVDVHDGSLQHFSFSDDWNELRHSSSAYYVIDAVTNYFSNYYKPINEPGYVQEGIDRVSLPFDTSFIPDNALINSAILKLKVHYYSVWNTHPNSSDFVVLVPTTLENPPELNIEDFDEFGSVDNPLELSNRFDFSEELKQSGLTTLNLNQNGIIYINRTNFTVFGMRGGYDLSPETPNGGEDTYFTFQFTGATSVFGGSKLIINYTLPFCGNSILETGEQCDDGNNLDGDTCNSACQLSYCAPGHLDNGDNTCTLSITEVIEDGSVYNISEFEWIKDTTNVRLDIGRRVDIGWLTHRSYIEWDVSKLPDQATITDTHFLHSGGYQIDSQIWSMYLQPSGYDAYTIFNEIGRGVEYDTPNAFPALGGSDVDLGLVADRDLQSNLFSDRFAIGMKSSNENAASGSWVESSENLLALYKPTLVVTYTLSVCGNGIVEAGEGCDDGNTNNNDACKNDCTKNICGDSIVYTNVEICDDGNTLTCSPYPGCSADCQREVKCGNRIKECNEQCDDGNIRNGDGCSSSCRITSGGGRTGSFLPGTRILMSDNSLKNIEDIKVGELVKSYDENKKEIVNAKVTAVLSHEMSGYYTINDHLQITETNPIRANNGWTYPGSLEIGDELLGVDDELYVEGVYYTNKEVIVYNLQIEPTNTYFASGINVHNIAVGEKPLV